MKAKLTLPNGKEIEVEVSEEQVEKMTKKESGWWEPKEDESFFIPVWTISEYPFCKEINFHGQAVLSWLAFRTQEECQEWIDKQVAITKIRKYAAETWGTFVPDWNDDKQRKYMIIYDFDDRIFFRDHYHTLHFNAFEFFKEETHALTIIQKFEPELKTIFWIE